MSNPISERKKYVRKKKYKSKRSGEEKVIIDIVLSMDTYKLLEKIAQKLFPDLVRGRISYTIEHIIKSFAVMYTQSDTRKVNPRPTTQQLARAIQEQIKFERGSLSVDIPQAILRQYVMLVRGIKTPRRADEWIYRMYIEGIIKPRNIRKGEEGFFIKPSKISNRVVWEWVLVL